MKVKYFPDTDTLLVTLSDNRIVETRDLSEDALAEFDEMGHVVSVTLEHAKEQTDVEEFVIQRAAAS